MISMIIPNAIQIPAVFLIVVIKLHGIPAHPGSGSHRPGLMATPARTARHGVTSRSFRYNLALRCACIPRSF